MEKCTCDANTQGYDGNEFHWSAANICHANPVQIGWEDIVRKYIIPALPLDSISDQFAYRPTGSTTAALVSLTHIVAQKLSVYNTVYGRHKSRL